MIAIYVMSYLPRMFSHMYVPPGRWSRLACGRGPVTGSTRYLHLPAPARVRPRNHIAESYPIFVYARQRRPAADLEQGSAEDGQSSALFEALRL